MYVNEHHTIALTHERINDLHRDAAKLRLEREARGGSEKSVWRALSFSSILSRFVPQPAAEPTVKAPALRRV